VLRAVAGSPSWSSPTVGSAPGTPAVSAPAAMPSSTGWTPASAANGCRGPRVWRCSTLGLSREDAARQPRQARRDPGLRTGQHAAVLLPAPRLIPRPSAHDAPIGIPFPIGAFGEHRPVRPEEFRRRSPVRRDGLSGDRAARSRGWADAAGQWHDHRPRGWTQRWSAAVSSVSGPMRRPTRATCSHRFRQGCRPRRVCRSHPRTASGARR
jgi:hypothetical protein